MNRKELIKAFRDEGYAEATPSLDSLKAYAETNGITFKDADGVVDLAEAWNTKSEVTVKETEQPIERKANSEAAKKAIGRVVAATENKTFSIGRSQMVAKAYNAKAARGQTIFPDADTAEFAGACMRYGIAEHFGKSYDNKANDEAIIKTATTIDNVNAGNLVPVEYVASLIYNTEKVGMTRSTVNVQPMGRDNVTVPRKTGIGSMSWVNEAGEIPATSEQSFDTIALSPRKLGRIIKASREIVNDSAINFAETTASSIRESFDIAVDTAFVLGDGTSTYGNHLGLANITGSGNIVANTGAGNSWSALTVQNFLDTMASIKNANEERCHWLFTKEFYYSVCMKLDKAASQFRQLVGPPPAGFNGWFLDKPVKFLPSITGMPMATGSAQRCAYYGDFVGAVTMGLRSDIGIEFSDQAYWANDLVAWKATARCHINIHGSGRSTSNIAYLVTT